MDRDPNQDVGAPGARRRVTHRDGEEIHALKPGDRGKGCSSWNMLRWIELCLSRAALAAREGRAGRPAAITSESVSSDVGAGVETGPPPLPCPSRCLCRSR